MFHIWAHIHIWGDQSEICVKMTSYIFENTLIRFDGLNYPCNPLFLNIITQKIILAQFSSILAHCRCRQSTPGWGGGGIISSPIFEVRRWPVLSSPQYFKVECHIIPTKYLKYQQKTMKEIAGLECRNAKIFLARIQQRLSRCRTICR